MGHNIVVPNKSYLILSYCSTEHCSGSRSDGSGGTWSCSIEAVVGRQRASTDELAGRTRVAAQQLHVPSVSSAVQLGCAGGFPGRIPLEMPSVPAASQHAEGFFFHLDVSQHTLVDWSNFIRDVCAEDTRRNPVQLGGFDANGQPIVVEIDESYFFHRKYHRGRFHNGLWVFGAIERESGRCMLQVVADRTAQTLLPIIQQWCIPGTHIISDGWPSYQNIPQLNGGVFLHDVLIHQVNFVDPNNPEIHTQNIENLWMRAKCKLRRQFGMTRPLLATYLEEFMWQQRNKDHRRRLAGLLGCIRQQYP